MLTGVMMTNDYLRFYQKGSSNLQDMQDEASIQFAIKAKYTRPQRELKYGIPTLLVFLIGGYVYYRRPASKKIKIG